MIAIERPSVFGDDEAVSALVDRQLSATEAERLRRRLAYEPVLARRFAAIGEVSATIGRAYTDTADVLEWMLVVFRHWCREVRHRDPWSGPACARGGPSSGRPAPRPIDWAIAALPSEQRRALCLVDVEGMTYAEAGAALEVGPGEIKSHVARARAACLRYLGAAGAEAGGA